MRLRDFYCRVLVCDNNEIRLPLHFSILVLKGTDCESLTRAAIVCRCESCVNLHIGVENQGVSTLPKFVVSVYQLIQPLLRRLKHDRWIRQDRLW